jgi:hypothetical protein
MMSARILVMSVVWVVMSSPLTSAQDLSRYRKFQLGMSVSAVASQAGIAPEARLIYQRPELSQELMWLPPENFGSSKQRDSVRKVLFSFYNDQLFRIVVNYSWNQTEGLTVEDMVEALSVMYGPATSSTSETGVSPSRGYSVKDRIVAQWQDPQYTLDLVRPSYASTFELVLTSKSIDALARTANLEAKRLDEQEAPRRAVERQQKQADDDHARHEAARRVNRVTFRP